MIQRYDILNGSCCMKGVGVALWLMPALSPVSKVYFPLHSVVVWLNLIGGWYDAALTQCKLWAIDRSVFKTILTRTGMQKHADYVEFLKRFGDPVSPFAISVCALPHFSLTSSKYSSHFSFSFFYHVTHMQRICIARYILCSGFRLSVYPSLADKCCSLSLLCLYMCMYASFW